MVNRSGREARSGRFMALVWERQQLIEGGQNICDHSAGGVEVGIQISLGNKFPNLVKIKGSFRVEIVAGHLSRLEPDWERRAALFSRKRAKTSSPGMGFTLPLFKSSYRLLSVSRVWANSSK